jgi:hypothetical protein
MMGTEMVPEMENFNHLTWLMIREDFIKVIINVKFGMMWENELHQFK